MKLSIRSLTPNLWPALEELFSDKRNCGDCWCMYWRIGGAYRRRPRNGNKADFREIVKAGPPEGRKIVIRKAILIDNIGLSLLPSDNKGER